MPQAENPADAFRRQALKLNDEVLQGLAVAKMAFDNGDDDKGRQALAESLEQLRQVIDQMLSQGDGLAAGDFVRGHLLMGRMDD